MDNDKEYTILDFVKKNIRKKWDASHSGNYGTPKEKRDDILSNSKQILPGNRKPFWENITTYII